MKGTFFINGRKEEWSFAPDAVLLDVLRENGRTEVHRGCGEGACGSCAVVLDGALVNSCQVFTASAQEKEILTVAGIGSIHSPHPLQSAFVETGAVQCGFCTPGMVLSAKSLIEKNQNPTELEIREALSGNLCRCTGYQKIVEAVKIASETMKK